MTLPVLSFLKVALASQSLSSTQILELFVLLL